MEAASVVLMDKVDGILEKELGSYEINEGMEYIDKAYVEDNKVHLFLTTNFDVEDDETYNNIFDEYDLEGMENLGFVVNEIEDEYNPTWEIVFDYNEEYSITQGKLVNAINYHINQIRK